MTPSDLDPVREYIASRIIGQKQFIDSMLICLLSNGHLLVEGMPGLAKTTAVKTLSDAIEGDFHRVQFTPDLLPSDLIGTDIYRHEKGDFEFRPGPLFHNILLADEVNRAPAKVQSALLEAMGEYQITVGQTHLSPAGTLHGAGHSEPGGAGGHLSSARGPARPISDAGAGGLPERGGGTGDPGAGQQPTAEEPKPPSRRLPQGDLFAMRQDVAKLYLDPKLNKYIVDLVQATRNPAVYDSDLARWCRFGASPRASIALARCARARAWLSGDNYVSPQHIKAVAPEILRHRILLTFEGEAEGITTDDFINRLWIESPFLEIRSEQGSR